MTTPKPRTTERPEITPEFVEMLRCPKTGSKLSLSVEQGASWLVAEEGGARYPIINGIPNLLPDSGRSPESAPASQD